MNIKKVTETVNGQEKVTYADGKTLPEALAELFEDQGDFYEKVCGVNRIDASLAGWHSGDYNFNSACQGWRKFIADKGKIQKEVIEEQVDIFEEVLRVGEEHEQE